MDAGLLPASPLFWHYCKIGESGAGLAYDYSGNDRHLTSVASPFAAVQASVWRGEPAFYFNGSTTVPMAWGSAVSGVRHIFIVAAYEDATFSTNNGLLSGASTADVLTGKTAASTEWFDFNYDASQAYVYKINGVTHAESAAPAPMSGQFKIIEIRAPLGLSMDGLQVGMQRAFTTRRWKGWFAEDLAYNRILTDAEAAKSMFYFTLKYKFNIDGVDLYFPSDDIVPMKRTRFYAEPPDYGVITESYEFADGGRTFNEKADNTVRRWQYEYSYLEPHEAVIFDAFFDAVRYSRPFKFRDKYGVVWDNVRVESYNRTHDGHKSWNSFVSFALVKHP